MASDVTIEIYGKVTIESAAEILGLAQAVEAEAMVDWDRPVDADELLDLMKEAAEQGRPLLLTRSDTNNHFDLVTGACQAADLSYVVNYGPSGTEGYTDGISWTPGMEAEYHFEISGDGPSIKVSEVMALMAKGQEEMKAHLDTLQARSTPGKIEVEEGFEAAWEAALEADEVSFSRV